ncbi:MAG: DUF58 domain-containing protein [Acidiferrobacteraceae bacterium]
MSANTDTLGTRHIYLLPTREGLLFTLILLVLLLGAINYDNGLAYAFTFLLAATVVVSMTAAQHNLAGLNITEVPPQPAFAGDNVRFRVLLKNDQARRRWGIVVGIAGGPSVRIDLDTSEHRMVELPVRVRRRGPVPPPVVQLATRYPFGLLRVSSRRFPLSESALAYPAPAPAGELPATLPGDGDTPVAQDDVAAERLDFSGLAPHRPGDNPHHIHWKAAAAGRGLLIKRFSGSGDDEIWLRLPRNAAVEPQLRVLCRQVLMAERRGARYGLDLGVPASVIPPGRGGHHEERCLRQLALYGYRNA